MQTIKGGVCESRGNGYEGMRAEVLGTGHDGRAECSQLRLRGETRHVRVRVQRRRDQVRDVSLGRRLSTRTSFFVSADRFAYVYMGKQVTTASTSRSHMQKSSLRLFVSDSDRNSGIAAGRGHNEISLFFWILVIAFLRTPSDGGQTWGQWETRCTVCTECPLPVITRSLTSGSIRTLQSCIHKTGSIVPLSRP